MSLPWHIPLEAAPCFKEKLNAVQPTLLKHYCNINVHENPCEELQTGLMCDIGLDNREPATIQRLIASGMTVARLNMQNLEPEACAQLIQSIRQAVYNYSLELDFVYPLAVVVDVKGPDIVTGGLKNGPHATVELLQTETIRLTIDPSWRDCGTSECLYVGYDQLTDLNTDDIIYIDSLSPGKIKLVVTEVGDDSLECLIVIGGTIGASMAVRISSIPMEVQSCRRDDSADSISDIISSSQAFEHLDEQVNWATASDVDALLVPNCQGSHDIKQIKEMLSEKGKHILVLACIDTVLGLDNIDEVLEEADGIYVDRSVLSTDLPVEKIFLAQKQILAKCNAVGKPCLCKAVLNEQIPTLCVTDLANLVLDGADVLSLELHYDSPLKKFAPLYDAIRMAEHCLGAAGVICRQAERITWKPNIHGNQDLLKNRNEDPTKSVCITAAELAALSQAVVIICLTNSGRTAKILSYIKPVCPIVAVTRTCHTARQLRFWRGVRAVHYFESPKGNWLNEVESRIFAALNYCKAKRMLRAGDAYVIISGSRRGVGYCDSVKLLFASVREATYLE
ncbi:pyruvate kinase-like [Bombyx mandarina]|uniref:Pyruvate kinase n=2 Tax=Bombyx TaxID=7090 RepID=A0A8R2G850_BOMMO|nr:pyruvate kinase [Bombyx mori]XP_028043110.1 pyruvate kinase-like [Bombyx mandarina]